MPIRSAAARTVNSDMAAAPAQLESYCVDRTAGVCLDDAPDVAAGPKVECVARCRREMHLERHANVDVGPDGSALTRQTADRPGDDVARAHCVRSLGRDENVPGPNRHPHGMAHFGV